MAPVSNGAETSWVTFIRPLGYYRWLTAVLPPPSHRAGTYLRYSLIYFACVRERERKGCLLLVGYMDWAGEQKCCPKGHWAAKEQQGRSPCGQQSSSPTPQYPSQPLIYASMSWQHTLLFCAGIWDSRTRTGIRSAHIISSSKLS